MTVVLVLLGGALGAPARYLTDQWVQARHDSALPWGTLTVNTVGSFLLGFLAGAAAGGVLPSWVLTAAGTGFCGALTTFSTFSYETLRLVEMGSWRPAATNIGLSVVLGLAVCALGWALGSAL